jgi:hypothetical protein
MINEAKNKKLDFELLLIPILSQSNWILNAVQVEKKCLTVVDPLFRDQENWLIYFINF